MHTTRRAAASGSSIYLRKMRIFGIVLAQQRPQFCNVTAGGTIQTVIRLLNNNRRALIAIAMVVAFVAVVIPMCRMIGCSMSGMSASMMHTDGLGFFGTCGGTWVSSSTLPAAVPPAAALAFIVLALSALFPGSFAFHPALSAARVSMYDTGPPPRPESPLGVRLRL